VYNSKGHVFQISNHRLCPAFCLFLGNGPWFGLTDLPKGRECVSERDGG